MSLQGEVVKTGWLIGTSYLLSYAVNQFGPNLHGVPGYQLIANIKEGGLVDSGVGLFILAMVAGWLQRMVGGGRFF